VDRQSNKVIAFKVGNEEISNAYKMTYEILSGHGSDRLINNEQFNVTIENLCSDGHHAYDKVFDMYKNNINKHIISKSETCLVESYNSSMRDRLARLHRKSKAYSKNINMLTISINLWANSKEIFKNIDKYYGYSEYINNLAPVKHLETMKNHGMNREAA
jgi:IS1 family transposase